MGKSWQDHGSDAQSELVELEHVEEDQFKTMQHLNDEGVLQGGLAPITSSDLFKPEKYFNRTRSTINVNDFLSREGQTRQPSSLKASTADLGAKVISLGTGRPAPRTYPFNHISFNFASPDYLRSALADDYETPPPEPSNKASLMRDAPHTPIDLSIALSYGYSLGSEQMIQFLTTHVSHFHSPPYSDWEVCLTIGNTSALDIALRNFADPGDPILVEKYTYSGMIEASKALNHDLIPIEMDENGLSADTLDRTLSVWDSTYPGRAKPKLLYTIPTGHNPTGLTQPESRRNEVLTVADKHDLLIIEDDPYHYLHFNWVDKFSGPKPSIPSYLSLSKSGRVIRLDTTSKILAPGLRLGWLTAPKVIVESFQAAHDLGIVHPSGISQAMVYKLLSEIWGHDGFAEWLFNLAKDYQRKSKVMLKAMKEKLGSGSLEGICTWDRIQGGMFIWLQIDCSPILDTMESRKTGTRACREGFLKAIEQDISSRALKHGVLCSKGSYFHVIGTRSAGDEENPDPESSTIYLRLTFASAKDEQLIEGIDRLANALREVFGLAS